MSRKLCVCWIFLWITTAADANYTISNRTYTWEEAITNGNIAIPSIEVNNSSLTVNVTVDVNNKEAWVGYYMKETAFAYIGCWRLNNAEPKILLPINMNSPGLCYSMCEKSHRKYIGLSYGNCSCMPEKPNDEDIRHQECNSSPDGNWIAGGGDEYMSIYEIMKTDIDVTNGFSGRKCLVFQSNNQRWWRSCHQPYIALCKKGDDIFSVSRNSQFWFKWSYYVQSCFKNKSFPITYNDILHTSINLATGETWTNVIRSGVIYKYNDFLSSTYRGNLVRYGYVTKNGSSVYLNFTENNTFVFFLEFLSSIDRGNLVRYGYVTKNGSSVYLNFTENGSDERKSYIMQTLPVARPTSTQVQTSTASHTSHTFTTQSTRLTSFLDKEIVTKDPTSSPIGTSTITANATKGSISYTTSTWINDGPVNSTKGYQSKSKTNTSNSSDVSVPVSTSVVAIIILAVIVVIVTLKRRGKLPGICTKNSVPDNTSERKAETILAEKNVYVESPISDYEQISELQDNNNLDVKPDLDVENGGYGHTYFVLEPGSRESHTDGDISDSRKEETEMNDDYNTLHSTKNLGTKADDTYDTTEKAAIKLKAIRNTGCDKESPEKPNENEEDTYNHISRNLLKNNKTDNIYGVPDNKENDYGDVNNGCENNRHNGDDTYSHLNTTH